MSDRRGSDQFGSDVTLSRRTVLIGAAVIAVVAIFFVVSLLGGGDSEEAAPTSGFPAHDDACQMLDDDAVRDATGIDVDRKLHDSATAPRLCQAFLQGEGGQQVNLLIARGSAAAAYESAPPGDPVAGVGDAAKWNDGLKALSVRTGNDAFTLTMIRPDPTGTSLQREAVTIARSVIERLAALPLPAVTTSAP